jgi:hypothetical protein
MYFSTTAAVARRASGVGFKLGQNWFTIPNWNRDLQWWQEQHKLREVAGRKKIVLNTPLGIIPVAVISVAPCNTVTHHLMRLNNMTLDSVTNPYGRILGFLDRSRYFFFQVAPQLYSRGWVDPVTYPLFLTKSGRARNWTRTSGSLARSSGHWTTDAVRPKHVAVFNFFYI